MCHTYEAWHCKPRQPRRGWWCGKSSFCLSLKRCRALLYTEWYPKALRPSWLRFGEECFRVKQWRTLYAKATTVASTSNATQRYVTPIDLLDTCWQVKLSSDNSQETWWATMESVLRKGGCWWFKVTAPTIELDDSRCMTVFLSSAHLCFLQLHITQAPYASWRPTMRVKPKSFFYQSLLEPVLLAYWCTASKNCGHPSRYPRTRNKKWRVTKVFKQRKTCFKTSLKVQTWSNPRAWKNWILIYIFVFWSLLYA